MNVENWPRLVSVAYILCDQQEVIDKNSFIIKPHGFIIPPESTEVHGITTAEAISRGKDISTILEVIKQKVDDCDYIIGHNVVFDINVLNAEFYRHNGSLPIGLKPYLCTMALSNNYCSLPNNKYPTLEELYHILKGEQLHGAHDAMVDVQATMECFWLLKDSGIISTEKNSPSIRIYPTKDNLQWALKNLSLDYSRRAFAFLALVYNLKFNRSNFTSLFVPFHGKDTYIEHPLTKYTEENNKLIVKEYSEEEWIEDCFQVFYEALESDNLYVKLLEVLKKIDEETGVDRLIDEYTINKPCSSLLDFEIKDSSIWHFLAIKTSVVKRKKLFSDKICVDLFKKMIVSVNHVRKRLNDEQLQKYHETHFLLEVEKLQESGNDRFIPDQKTNQTSSSKGCIFLLPMFLCVSSAFCLTILLIVNIFK